MRRIFFSVLITAFMLAIALTIGTTVEPIKCEPPANFRVINFQCPIPTVRHNYLFWMPAIILFWNKEYIPTDVLMPAFIGFWLITWFLILSIYANKTKDLQGGK